MPNTTSHTVVLIAMIVLVPVALYVAKALWATMRTIAEQRRAPGPAAPLLLTAGMVAMVATLAYVAWLTQVAGAA